MKPAISHAHKLLFAVTSLWLAAIAVAGPLPRLSGAVERPECADALKLASSMFTSRYFHLYAPLSLPDKMYSKLVLGTPDLDISGGNALVADETLFEKVPQLGSDAIRSVYWESQPKRQVRIVVKERSVGWRGDMYSLYLLKVATEQADFLDDMQEGLEKVPQQQPEIQNSLRPPLVFRDGLSGKMWILSVGEPYQELADWTVYAEKTGSFEPICRVNFTPSGTAAAARLPKQVKDLAILLDKTLGAGESEGTLQPTAKLKVLMRHVWANVAIRPWSIESTDASNTREEVDGALRTWAYGDASAGEVYKQIVQAYPKAEKALSHYYSSQFGLPGSKANELAKNVLDAAFRSNFRF
jgi:hypothetical protein